MSARTLLAVPITLAEPPLAEQVEAARRGGADIVELRVDGINDSEAVAALLDQVRPVPFIVTIRAADEGGQWDGDDAERIALFERLGLKLPGYVDVEYATWVRSANLRQKVGLVGELGEGGGAGAAGTRRRKNRLILSHHDWRGTPEDIEAAAGPLLETPADVVKVVFTARDARDAWRVLAWLRRKPAGRDVIALAMGGAGLLTRVLARKFGGFLTFAALERGGESAPGQPTVRELLETYRWRDIGPQTRVFGVIGSPLGHTLSPRIHNAAMAAAGIDGVYVPMPVGPEREDFVGLLDMLSAQPELDVAGLSVTIPHKGHALRWLEAHGMAVSDLARRAGAVNTLTRTGADRWAGDNTDTAGVLAALGDAGRACDVAVLGAGGAARAAVVGLLAEGCRVTVFNRTAARAEQIADELGCAWGVWERRVDMDVAVVINCTSVGMFPEVDATPLPVEALRPGMVVLDTVYNPAETKLLCDAQEAGCRVISGVEMFVAQAAAQFERWHEQSAPRQVMRAAVVEES